MNCDIVICAHDEAMTVGRIVTSCANAMVGAVIVVADACTDNTADEATAYGADLVLEVNGRDKGSAMAVGLAAVESDWVLFCDADLRGLTARHIEALATAPPLDGQLVGLTESEVNRWSKWEFPPITGERRLPTAFARTIPMEGQGYKVELVIDAAVGRAHLPHRACVMHGVTNPTRMYEDPVGWSAMWADLGLTSLRYLPDLVRYTLG